MLTLITTIYSPQIVLKLRGYDCKLCKLWWWPWRFWSNFWLHCKHCLGCLSAWIEIAVETAFVMQGWRSWQLNFQDKVLWRGDGENGAQPQILLVGDTFVTKYLTAKHHKTVVCVIPFTATETDLCTKQSQRIHFFQHKSLTSWWDQLMLTTMSR